MDTFNVWEHLETNNTRFMRANNNTDMNKHNQNHIIHMCLTLVSKYVELQGTRTTILDLSEVSPTALGSPLSCRSL